MGIEGARARARRTESFFFRLVLVESARRYSINRTKMPHHVPPPVEATALSPSVPTHLSSRLLALARLFFFFKLPISFLFFFTSFLLCNDTVSSDGQNVQQARKQYQRIVHPYSIRQIWLKSFRSSVVSNQWNRPNNKKKIDTATDNKRRRRLDLTVTFILALLF